MPDNGLEYFRDHPVYTPPGWSIWKTEYFCPSESRYRSTCLHVPDGLTRSEVQRYIAEAVGATSPEDVVYRVPSRCRIHMYPCNGRHPAQQVSPETSVPTWVNDISRIRDTFDDELPDWQREMLDEIQPASYLDAYAVPCEDPDCAPCSEERARRYSETEAQIRQYMYRY